MIRISNNVDWKGIEIEGFGYYFRVEYYHTYIPFFLSHNVVKHIRIGKLYIYGGEIWGRL